MAIMWADPTVKEFVYLLWNYWGTVFSECQTDDVEIRCDIRCAEELEIVLQTLLYIIYTHAMDTHMCYSWVQSSANLKENHPTPNNYDAQLQNAPTHIIIMMLMHRTAHARIRHDRLFFWRALRLAHSSIASIASTSTIWSAPHPSRRPLHVVWM